MEKRKRGRSLGSWRRKITGRTKEKQDRRGLRYPDLLRTGMAGEPLLYATSGVQRIDDGLEVIFQKTSLS